MGPRLNCCTVHCSDCRSGIWAAATHQYVHHNLMTSFWGVLAAETNSLTGQQWSQKTTTAEQTATAEHTPSHSAHAAGTCWIAALKLSIAVCMLGRPSAWLAGFVIALCLDCWELLLALRMHHSPLLAKTKIKSIINGGSMKKKSRERAYSYLLERDASIARQNQAEL